MQCQNASLISKRYYEFKTSINKIGFDEAYTQYGQINYDLGSEAWIFNLLCEFFYIQGTVLRHGENPDQANRNIRAQVRLLSSELFLREHADTVISALDWFDDLEAQDVTATRRQGDLRHVIEGFVHLPTRRDLIRYILFYDNLNYRGVMDDLLFSAKRLTSRYHIYLSDMLYVLIERRPEYAPLLRFRLLEMELLPDLITRLTVVHCKDEIDFLNGVFYGLPSWFMAQSASSASYYMAIKSRICAVIDSCMQQPGNRASDNVRLACAIRALAGLVGYMGIKLTDNEIKSCIQLLRASKAERLVKLLLSLMLIASDQALRLQRDFTVALTELLQSGVSEMPMLLMVYFQTDQFSQIEMMTRSIFDMQVTIPKFGLFEMQKLFLSIQNNKAA